MSDWQPIETAPKDGTVIIGYDPSHEEMTNMRTGGVEFTRWDGYWIDPFTDKMAPTHWMPLPEPPK